MHKVVVVNLSMVIVVLLVAKVDLVVGVVVMLMMKMTMMLGVVTALVFLGAVFVIPIVFVI